MKRFSQRIIFVLGFCFLFSVNSAFAQKNKNETEVESKPVETKVETKTETPSPPSPPPTRDESPPSYEAPQSEPTQNSRSSDNDTPTSTPINTTGIRNEAQQKGRRDQQRQEIERRRKEEERRNKNKDDYNPLCPEKYSYENCDDVTDTYNNTPVDPLVYFNGNDIAILAYQSYVENDSNNYLPYFDNILSPQYVPLHSVFLTEVSRDLPFTHTNWIFYYEPDLDNFFIDFARFGQLKLERLVMTPIGKTIKAVRKEYNYNGTEMRPLLVEDISNLMQDKIYSFSLSGVPKGFYELKLINRDGDTVKSQIEVK